MWFVGIDWSHQKLDYELRDAAGRVLSSGDVRSTAEGLADLFVKLDRHAPPEQIAIAFEAVNLAWVQALCDRGYTLYPLNPKMVKSFRETLSAAGDKSDSIDRGVLAQDVGCGLPHQLRGTGQGTKGVRQDAPYLPASDAIRSASPRPHRPARSWARPRSRGRAGAGAWSPSAARAGSSVGGRCTCSRAHPLPTVAGRKRSTSNNALGGIAITNPCGRLPTNG